MTILKLAALAGLAIALGACSTSGNGTAATSAGASVAASAPVQAQRTRLSRDEIIAAYTGRTLTASDHAQTYNADGTWTNRAGQTGRWSVSDDDILSMTGPVNLRLEVYQQGSGYYHRNVVSGQGAYYTA